MKTLILSVLMLAWCCISAQSDSLIFKDVKNVAVNEYIFTVPQGWRKLDQVDISSIDRKFDFSGIGLPDNYKGSPLNASFSLRGNKCDSLAPAVEFVLNELTSYPDRLTPPGENYSMDTLRIASGQMGVLFSSRYYRRTKALNYSRFDLIVYSIKRKTAYLLNITYQYRDSTYSIERALNLRQYAIRVLKSLVLR